VPIKVEQKNVNIELFLNILIVLFNCFIDFQKAFDLITHEVIWVTFRPCAVGTRLIEILQNISKKVAGELGDWFRTTVGI